MPDKLRFPECRSCINLEFDPFECKLCKNGSNFETQQNDEIEELTISEFINIMRDEDGY